MVQAARRARILRRLQGAAVAGAWLVAVRAVPGVRRDHRPRARHLAQLPRGGGRPGRQHRAAAAARARRRRGPRHRRRGAGAVRRLCGDARGHVRAHTHALPASASSGAACAQLVAILGGVAVSGELLLPTQRPRRAGRCGSLGSALVPGAAAAERFFIRTSVPRRAALLAEARRRVAALPRRARGGRGLRRGPAARPLRPAASGRADGTARCTRSAASRSPSPRPGAAWRWRGASSAGPMAPQHAGPERPHA